MFRAHGATTQVLQENHYYHFGMEMEGAWTAQVGTENKYQYNGKELVEDFGWIFAYRNSDQPLEPTRATTTTPPRRSASLMSRARSFQRNFLSGHLAHKCFSPAPNGSFEMSGETSIT